MPIYEYGCPDCGHQFELMQRISEKPKKSCPSCKSRRLEKLISNTSFVLKGGGWYVTDYAKKSSSESPSSSNKKTSTSSGDDT